MGKSKGAQKDGNIPGDAGNKSDVTTETQSLESSRLRESGKSAEYYEAIREASVGGGYYYYGDPDKDAYLYRPLTQRDLKDLSPLTQKKMQDLAFYLFDQNLMAHRIIEMTKDFVLGEGVTVAPQRLISDFR